MGPHVGDHYCNEGTVAATLAWLRAALYHIQCCADNIDQGSLAEWGYPSQIENFVTYLRSLTHKSDVVVSKCPSVSKCSRKHDANQAMTDSAPLKCPLKKIVHIT